MGTRRETGTGHEKLKKNQKNTKKPYFPAHPGGKRKDSFVGSRVSWEKNARNGKKKGRTAVGSTKKGQTNETKKKSLGRGQERSAKQTCVKTRAELTGA